MYTTLPSTLPDFRLINEVFINTGNTVKLIPSDKLSIYDGPMPLCSCFMHNDDDLISNYNGLMPINDRLKLDYGDRAFTCEIFLKT